MKRQQVQYSLIADYGHGHALPLILRKLRKLRRIEKNVERLFLKYGTFVRKHTRQERNGYLKFHGLGGLLFENTSLPLL